VCRRCSVVRQDSTGIPTDRPLTGKAGTIPLISCFSGVQRKLDDLNITLKNGNWLILERMKRRSARMVDVVIREDGRHGREGCFVVVLKAHATQLLGFRYVNLYPHVEYTS